MNTAKVWYEFWMFCPEWAEVDFEDPDVTLELEDGDAFVVELEE